MLNVAIVDDKETERKRISDCLEYVAQKKNVEFAVREFSSADRFLIGYESGYDIIFMDIDFSVGSSGMDAARQLRKIDKNVIIIFVTNMAQMAVQGYEVDALDFIVKPFDKYTFSLKMTRALGRITVRRNDEIIITVNGNLNSYIQVAISLYAIICCVMALFIQLFLHNFTILKSNYYVLQRINEEEKKQYNLSRTNTELLNIKCHDLKHFLLSRKNLPQEETAVIAEIIGTYDNLYKTGSDALDIILNEKSMFCSETEISLTFMGDGKILDFMSATDIYSMFGNILENAIEASEKIDVAERKAVSLTVEQKGDFVCVNCTNFINESLPAFDGGLPPTTKKSGAGFHGYGLKSIRNIAEKYGGGIGIDTDGDVFILNVYMMR